MEYEYAGYRRGCALKHYVDDSVNFVYSSMLLEDASHDYFAQGCCPVLGMELL